MHMYVLFSRLCSLPFDCVGYICSILILIFPVLLLLLMNYLIDVIPLLFFTIMKCMLVLIPRLPASELQPPDGSQVLPPGGPEECLGET